MLMCLIGCLGEETSTLRGRGETRRPKEQLDIGVILVDGGAACAAGPARNDPDSFCLLRKTSGAFPARE